MADSLIQQIQQLGIPQQAQIMQELNNKYPESLELTTAYTQLIEWIQNQTWVHLQLDRNNEEHCKQAKILMGEISAQLQPDSMNFHGVVTARALLSKYEADPISLVMAFQEINLFMITLVQRFIMTKNAGENAAMQEDVDDTMEEEVEDNVLEEINKDLSEATEESRKNERFLKQVEHSKEQYIILYQEKHSEATQLENQKKTLVGSSKQAEKIKLLEKKLSEIQQELNVKGNELTVTKRLAVYNILSEHHKKLTEIQKSIIAEINDWTNCQQKALSGWPKPQQLNDLQPLCEVHTELLCRLYQHIIKLDGMFRPALAQDKGELERIDNLKLNARNLLSHFLNKCFVIEKHPQQVLKTNTKFGVSLRHLIGGKLNAHIYPPDVTCTIVSEKYVRSLYQTKGKINPPPQDKNILNNKKTMEYNQKTNTFAVEFKNLSITRANRQGGKKEESVCEEKRCLQFVSEINIGREKYTVMTLSFPTVITVHGNQFPDAEATIIWDNAFAEPNRLPFDVPEKVSWPELAEALNKRWTFANERELSEPNMMYIAGKLFPGVSKDDLETCEVSRADFSREHLNGRPFTFWKWFFSILDVVKRNMLDEWRNGIIYGFMSKQDAQDELIKYQPGCFLVRFSDSELGGVTIAYTVPAGEVWNLSPWTNNNFAMRRFSDRIKDLEALTHLYPNEQGKDDAFGRYYSEDEKDVPQDPGEYRETVLATKVKGESGINTPMASPLHSGGHMDFMTNMAVRSITSSPPSICADSFDIANEEIVTSDGADAIEMLSNVSALIAESGCHESFSAIAAGIAQQPFTPISITEDQWPLSFN